MNLCSVRFNRRLFSFGLFVVVASVQSVFGAFRELRIDAPDMVNAGDKLEVYVSASTDANDEQVAFLQIEASVDGGKSWTALCYVNDVGPKTLQVVYPETNKGTIIGIRARAAYRSGTGDVDYRGQPIQWDGSWQQWAEPPAKIAITKVKSK